MFNVIIDRRYQPTGRSLLESKMTEQDTRTQIVAAAMTVLAEKGFAKNKYE
jgi:AcrR family transcriptional regulator